MKYLHSVVLFYISHGNFKSNQQLQAAATSRTTQLIPATVPEDRAEFGTAKEKQRVNDNRGSVPVAQWLEHCVSRAKVVCGFNSQGTHTDQKVIT